MSETQLNIDALGLTRADFTNLYVISTFSLPFMRHASKTPLLGLSLLARSESERFKEFAKEYSGSPTVVIPKAAVNHLLRSLRSCENGITQVNEIFRVYIDTYYRYYDFDNIWISKPLDILTIIKERHVCIPIQLDPESPRELEILFPQNVLFGVFLELLTNIHKVAGHDAKAIVKWGVNNGRFFCEFHDNGPGITKDLSDKALPLHGLKTTGSSLVLIEEVTGMAGGHLFFYKSRQLGGTLVRIDLVTRAYYQDGKVYGHKA